MLISFQLQYSWSNYSQDWFLMHWKEELPELSNIYKDMCLNEDIEEKVKYFHLILVLQSKFHDLYRTINRSCLFVKNNHNYYFN